MRDIKQVRNLLYAFNTDKFYTTDEFLERYPGDEYADIIGFDIYQRAGKQEFIKDANNMLAMLDSIAVNS